MKPYLSQFEVSQLEGVSPKVETVLFRVGKDGSFQMDVKSDPGQSDLSFVTTNTRLCRCRTKHIGVTFPLVLRAEGAASARMFSVYVGADKWKTFGKTFKDADLAERFVADFLESLHVSLSTSTNKHRPGEIGMVDLTRKALDEVVGTGKGVILYFWTARQTINGIPVTYPLPVLPNVVSAAQKMGVTLIPGTSTDWETAVEASVRTAAESGAVPLKAVPVLCGFIEVLDKAAMETPFIFRGVAFIDKLPEITLETVDLPGKIVHYNVTLRGCPVGSFPGKYELMEAGAACGAVFLEGDVCVVTVALRGADFSFGKPALHKVFGAFSPTIHRIVEKM